MNKKEFPKGLRPLDIFIHSIEKRTVSFDVEGVPGKKYVGSTDGGRLIEVSVGLQSDDTKDYRLLRDEAYAFFADDYFYLSESYQKGKRFKVSVIEPFIPTRLNQRVASVGFMLQTTELPYAESIGTTQDIQANGISSEDELWGYGMGLLAEDDSLVYTVNGMQPFMIYNAGNVPIHPFQQELKITMTAPSSVLSGSYVELKNLTNGTTFRMDEKLMPNEQIIIDGPNITKNGLQALRKTNKQFIQLSPGWNHFECNVNATIEFLFRFYYR